MHITIAERLRPYSHTPGVMCMLPGSALRLQIFPTRVVIHDLTQGDRRFVRDIEWDIQGPVADFTVISDLEKGRVGVWGQAASGFFRYWLYSATQGHEVFCQIEKGALVYSQVEISKDAFSANERLSLGNSKAQDWDLVVRRQDLAEILPVWFRLGQITPAALPPHVSGTASLLGSCREAISSNAPDTIVQPFLNLFNAGFKGILTPRLFDDQYQGLAPHPLPAAEPFSPLILLTEGSALIRSLFIQQQESDIHILPVLPPEFHCGRFTQVSLGDYGDLDIEWSKKTVRRLIFRSKAACALTFHFKKVQQFRLRRGHKDRGKIISLGTAVVFEGGAEYFFDCFE